MPKKQYKPGDRIFYEDFEGNICTDIVKRVEPDFYLDENNKKIKFNNLIIEEVENERGHAQMCIEDYSCLSSRNPKCKELVKKYKTFDKHRDKIIESFMKIMEPFDIEVKKEIIDLLKLKIEE